jgi:aryl-alcohol dehydrogenase-like predicted oxidoreductase
MSETLLAQARTRDDAAAGLPRRVLAGTATSVIGLGCSRLGSITNTDHSAGPRLIAAALDLGITLFDTADIYGQGDSERLLGQALRGRRDRVLLASKGGKRFAALGRAAAVLKAPLRLATRMSPALGRALRRGRGGQMAEDFSPQHLGRALEASLRRLGTDHLDIYYLHSPPEPVVRRAEAAALLARCREQGKLRHLGIAVDDPATAMAALDWPGVSVIQAPLPADRAPAFAGFLEAAAARGIAVVARELLGGGTRLAGAADRRAALAETLSAALRLPAVGACLIGTTRPDHVREAASAAATLR